MDPGSIGKGILTLQMASALASTQRPCCWIGPNEEAMAIPSAVRPTTCVMAGWEDSRDEILRRIHRLAGPGECQWVHDEGCGGEPHLSAHARQRATVGKPASHLWVSSCAMFCERIASRAADRRSNQPELCTMDEINRPEVSKALESWAGWAMDTGCTVLLVGHPSKATEGDSLPSTAAPPLGSQPSGACG